MTHRTHLGCDMTVLPATFIVGSAALIHMRADSRTSEVSLSEADAAALVNELMPYAARALALRWWDGEWWSRDQWNGHVGTPHILGPIDGDALAWDDLPLGPADPAPCPHCNDDGIVSGMDGSDQGPCDCEAGRIVAEQRAQHGLHRTSLCTSRYDGWVCNLPAGHERDPDCLPRHQQTTARGITLATWPVR